MIYQKKKGVVKASYAIALLVAKSMKALAIGESLVMPAAKILVKTVIGVKAAAKLETVSLSNNLVKNRIMEMSIDIADQVISGVKDSKFGFLYATGRVDGHNKQCSITRLYSLYYLKL